MARETADYAFGMVLEPEPLGSASRAHSLRVVVRGGTLSRGEVNFTWEAGRPPIQLGSPTDISYAYRLEALFLLDASRRLLVVSYEGQTAHDQLLSALGTARAPSRRFSEEELDWAWYAARSAGFRLPKPVSLQFEGIEPQPGHVELALRFGDLEKLEILGRLRWKPTLDAQDIEWLELGAHDIGGSQDEAVRTLLEHGLPVPSALFLSAGNRLSARLALGDEGAQREVLARLERAQRFLLWDSRAPHTPAEIAENEAARFEPLDSLLAIVAHGSPETRPLLTAFVQKGVKNSVFAWLALGGSAQELRALCGNDSLQRPWELTDAGTLGALDLELERVHASVERTPSLLSTELVWADLLIRRLRPHAPAEVLERVRPVLRACLELPGVPQVALRMSLLGAGDEEALAELARMSADELRGVPSGLAEHPGDEVVPILVKLLLHYLAGFDWDDTKEGPRGVASLSSQLHARSDADRARALRLFDAAELPPRASAGEVTFIRWALGELPEPQRLLEVTHSPVAVACRLDLAGEAPRYASILGELRKNPRRYWWSLAALHDEESLPVFGAWLTGKGDDRMAQWDALRAIEKMGSQAGASWIHDTLPGLEGRVREAALTVLGEIEAPGHLALLASLCAPAPVADRSKAGGSAFLVLLGRRP